MLSPFRSARAAFVDPNYSITLKRRTDVTLERLVFEMTNVTTQLKLTSIFLFQSCFQYSLLGSIRA